MASEPLVFVTGSKTFEIADYSIAKSVGNGNSIESEPFSVGGYDWVIQFYPKGINELVPKFALVVVKLVNTTKQVGAMYSFRLWEGFTAPITTPVSTNLATFWPAGGKASWGYKAYIERSVLNSSCYLKDDTLMIRCTLWVARDASSSTSS